MKRKMMRIILTGVCAVCLIACGKSEKDTASEYYQEQLGMSEEDADEPADAIYGSGEAQTGNNENIGTETEITVDERAGLYQSDGSFIPWNDLNIVVEIDCVNNYDALQVEEKWPYKVFADNAYNGELVFPNNITKIGGNTFLDCVSLTSIDLSNTQITSIESLAFSGCTSLTSVYLPDTLESIREAAFLFCESLASIDLSGALTNIENSVFSGCSSLTSINLSNTQTTSIGFQAFANCSSLTTIYLPDTLASIGEYAFLNCESLTSIDLSNTQITSIERATFCNCESLTSIYLPDTLTSIGSDVFLNCPSLTNIDYVGSMEEWNAIEKDDCWKGFSMEIKSSLETITCSDGVITLK